MTGTQKLHGPAGGNIFSQLGRALVLAAFGVAGLVMLFFSAAFALILAGTVAVIAALTVGFFWARAKLTGRPFGPKAMMEARMEELRAQMETQMGTQMGKQGAATFGSAFGTAQASEDGPVIDAHQTPQGWTVER